MVRGAPRAGAARGAGQRRLDDPRGGAPDNPADRAYRPRIAIPTETSVATVPVAWLLLSQHVRSAADEARRVSQHARAVSLLAVADSAERRHRAVDLHADLERRLLAAASRRPVTSS